MDMPGISGKPLKSVIQSIAFIPFWVIERALEGDIQAINKILKHYEGYIAKLSVRKMYDEYGCIHYCVDETLRRRLETKLIKTIIGFKIVR